MLTQKPKQTLFALSESRFMSTKSLPFSQASKVPLSRPSSKRKDPSGSGVHGGATYMLCLIIPATCKTGWRLWAIFGNTISALTSCTNPPSRTLRTRVTLTPARGRVFCSCPLISSPYRSNQAVSRFIVYPRPRATRRDQAAFKIKSVLKGTEYEGEAI